METSNLPDPRNTTTFRVLKAVVIILGVLIVIGFGLLVVGLFGAFGSHQAQTSATGVTDIALPPGAEIVSTAADNGRLIVRLHTHAGEEIDIIDTSTGELLGRMHTTPAQPR